MDDTLALLRELGGNATTLAIRLRAREKYPERSLSDYVSKRLHQLKRSGLVTRDDDGERRWRIPEAP